MNSDCFSEQKNWVHEDREKGCLILDVEKYRFQKFLSDIAGQDPRAHDNNISIVITIVRNWLNLKSDHRIPGGKKMFERYERFMNDLPNLCDSFEIEQEELTFNDWTDFITEWVQADTEIESSRPLKNSDRIKTKQFFNSSLGARVGFVVGFLQPFDRDVGVDLGGRQTRVTEQLLNAT